MRKSQRSSGSPRPQCARGYSMHIGSCRICFGSNDSSSHLQDILTVHWPNSTDASARSYCDARHFRSGPSVLFRVCGVFEYLVTPMARLLVLSWWLRQLLDRVYGHPTETERIQMKAWPPWLLRRPYSKSILTNWL